MKGLTQRLLEDPVGALLLIFVIGATAVREAEVVGAPWDKMIGTVVALLYAYGFVARPKKGGASSL